MLTICAQAQTPTELLSQAQSLAEQGDRYRAAPLFGKAEAGFHAAGHKRQELYAKFGELHAESDHGNYKAVRVEIERALETPIVQNDPELKIQALSVLGIVDMNIDTPAAAVTWKELLNTATEIGDKKWQNRAQGELGLVAGLSGNIAQAGAALFKSIATAEKLGDWNAAINFTIWMANGMALNGMADGALKQLDRAIDLAKQNGYDPSPFLLVIARLRAIAHLPEPARAEKMPEARQLFTAALRQAHDEKVYGAEIELLDQNGQLALDSGNIAEAEHSFSQAAATAHSAQLPGLQAEALLQLAHVYLHEGKPKFADEALSPALNEVVNSDEGYDLPLFVAAQAETEAALGHLMAADALYDRATTLLEGLLVNAPSSQFKSSMVSAFSQIYIAHFSFAWNQLHDGARAFEIIESARGRVLLDSIRYAQQSHSAAFASPAEIRITKLQSSLLHHQFTNSQLQQVLNQLDDAYDQLLNANRVHERAEVTMLRSAPLTLPALMRILSPDQVFIEYVLDQSNSYALEVSSGGMKVHKLPSREQITAMTKRYLTGVKATKDAEEASKALYLALLAPTMQTKWRSIVVVPDGILHLLPFESLQDQQGAYVVQHASVSAAPSATVLAALKRQPKTLPSKEFLGVAFSEIVTTPDASSSTRGITDLRGGDIKPLKFGHEEVNKANVALGGHGVILEGADATEANLKSEPLAEFKVIHLAAHGVDDESAPDRAAIVLAAGSQSEDGLWQAREIRKTKLNAQTVVLSACETGTGRLQGEEGIMNLARAFLTAGAKSVVASLWDVDDRSTATLMESFYQHLAAGASVAEALRLAQLDFIQTYKNKAVPYLWAGFEVIGDGSRTIVTTKNTESQAKNRTIR